MSLHQDATMNPEQAQGLTERTKRSPKFVGKELINVRFVDMG
jgi:hypothetical protein